MLDDDKKWEQPTSGGPEPLQEDLQSDRPRAAEDPVMALPEIPLAAEGAGSEQRHYADASEPPRNGRSGGWRRFAAALALVAMGAGVGSATTWGLTRSTQEEKLPIGVKADEQTTTIPVASVSDVNGLLPAIYKKVVPSVVMLSVTTDNGWLRGTSTGSGFVVDASGYILTNYHVIDDARSIQVKFYDGTILAGEVVGTDRYQDLAVVKVDPGDRGLVPVTLGDSDAVQVGELAVAIGSPFGQEFTMTAGIVSAVDRQVQEANNPFAIPGAIQTDAAINPGNSGGPLLNSRGEVIGINTLIETGSTGLQANVGIGFAVPINAAKNALPKLMKGERVEHPWLGVSMGTMSQALAQQIGSTVTEGALVSDVYDDSPAEKAGLRPAAFNRRGELVSADVIIQVDDVTVKEADDVVEYVQKKKVGDTITLKVVRGSETLTLTATLAARPSDLIE